MDGEAAQLGTAGDPEVGLDLMGTVWSGSSASTRDHWAQHPGITRNYLELHLALLRDFSPACMSPARSAVQ